MKPITINYRDHKITLSSAFKKRAFTVGTIEYEQLQAVRRDFVGFELEIRQFKKNTKQEHYKGLNYDFMRWYIQKVEGDNAPEVLAVFDKKKDIAKAHSTGKRYPTIKSWFLNTYPEFAEFGMTEEEIRKYRANREQIAAAAEKGNVTPRHSAEKIPA